MNKLSTGFYGYKKDEVNDLIKTFTSEYESMLTKLKKQDVEIQRLKHELSKYQNLESTLNQAIVMAENTSNQIKKIAKDEGRSIIEEAKRHASKILNDALIKSQDIETDAENLRRRIIGFKRKYRSALETEIEVIDEIAEKY